MEVVVGVFLCCWRCCYCSSLTSLSTSGWSQPTPASPPPPPSCTPPHSLFCFIAATTKNKERKKERTNYNLEAHFDARDRLADDVPRPLVVSSFSVFCDERNKKLVIWFQLFPPSPPTFDAPLTHWLVPVWPDWAIFKVLYNRWSYKSGPNIMTFWAPLKKSTF